MIPFLNEQELEIIGARLALEELFDDMDLDELSRKVGYYRYHGMEDSAREELLKFAIKCYDARKCPYV